jgi:hypothetical protein
MNVESFIEGILLILSWFVIVYFLTFVISSYYDIMYQKIKWKQDDENFDKSLKEFKDNYLIISKKEYEELKKVN